MKIFKFVLMINASPDMIECDEPPPLLLPPLNFLKMILEYFAMLVHETHTKF